MREDYRDPRGAGAKGGDNRFLMHHTLCMRTVSGFVLSLLSLLAVVACPAAGVAPSRPDTEDEGEAPAEGEGEAPAEGEGEAPAEGEGEGEARIDYGVDGPFAATTTERTATTDNGTFTVLVTLTDAPGPRPVVSISPGLLQPARAYMAYATRLATHGFLVLLRDDPGVTTQTSEVTADLVMLLTEWLPAENDDVSSPLAGRVDLSRIGVAGHSRGGKASLLAAETGLVGVVDAWFGLDPVDATTFSDPIRARDGLPGLTIPTVFFGADVVSSCNPVEDSWPALYPLAPSPSVLLVAVGAGHTQVQSQDACVACFACFPAGTADADVVLATAVRYLTAFFARELQGDAQVGAAFTGAGAEQDVAAGLLTLENR